MLNVTRIHQPIKAQYFRAIVHFLSTTIKTTTRMNSEFDSELQCVEDTGNANDTPQKACEYYNIIISTIDLKYIILNLQWFDLYVYI